MRWPWQPPVQAGTVTMFFSMKKGLHDRINHVGWCVDLDACDAVKIPVDRRGRVLPVRPPT